MGIKLAERFQWGNRCHIMGILNATPDSFSGDGLLSEESSIARATAQARMFVQEGADILDVGGESTRPGAEPVSETEEIERVVPVISALAQNCPQTVISVDTYRATVAQEALKAGAHIINDVWGLRADPDMGPLAAETNTPVILMHNRSKPGHATIDQRLGGQYMAPDYQNFLPEVKAEMAEMADRAMTCGLPRSQIILDPGIGFGKTVAQNMALINHLDTFRDLGFPTLSGPSRKSFIGRVLNLPVEERQEGTAAAVALSVIRGADIVRVHDVRAMTRVVRMTEAMLRAGGEQNESPSP